MSGQLNIKASDDYVTINPNEGALLKYLQKHGRFPPFSLSIFPLEDLNREIFIDKFMSYRFQSSILIPVDSWAAEIKYDLDLKDLSGRLRPSEGDIVVLRANGIPVATGQIDHLDMETDAKSGTKLTIQGRDLLGMWEDQDSVTIDSKILDGKLYTVDQVIAALAINSRINPKKIIKRTAPRNPYLFATQPGETKLSSIQRFCEALDIYFWMSGDGNLIIGKPDMYGIRSPSDRSRFFVSRRDRSSNVLSMRSSRNSTSVPAYIVPLWNGQEGILGRDAPLPSVKNRNKGPIRLKNLGHTIIKAIVTSTPQGSAPQDLADINALLVAGQQQNTQIDFKNAQTILNAYAEREMAKLNMKTLQVQVTTPGHYNDRAEPILIDQVYRIQYDVDQIDQDMFLYEVEYTMTEGEGQRTRMFFCPQDSLVSKVRAL